VAGYAASTPCCSDIFVRAYSSANGRVLWTDVWNKGRDDLPKGIAANSTAVVVVGYGGNAASLPATALDFLVRAFQPATGAVLWEDRVNKDLLADDVAWAVTIDGARVFVAGTTVTPEGQSDLVLRAYDLTTGLLFWESSRVDMSPPINLFVTNGRLFVSGANYLLPVDMASGNIATADIE
jgi:outer membrane protein assembly factor BamB